MKHMPQEKIISRHIKHHLKQLEELKPLIDEMPTTVPPKTGLTIEFLYNMTTEKEPTSC